MDWEYVFFRIGEFQDADKATLYVVLPSELNKEYTDPTLMATRAIFTAKTNGLPTAGGASVSLGVIAWDDINDTAPIGAEAPGPISNGNLDWVLRQTFPIAVGTPSGTTYSLALDEMYMSKARRRLGTSRGVLAVIEVIGVGLVSATGEIRCLVKE
jgi:hypothetical protein